MSKDVKYYSTDKLYKVKRKLNKRGLFIIGVLVAIVLLISTIICFNQSIILNPKEGVVNYSENGKVNYKVYLKDNNYYDSSYLNEGMQYIASLIKTVNVKYNYEVHSDKNLDYTYKYKITKELQITEKDDDKKILYSKKEDEIKETTKNVNDNNFVINEEIDIDYDKYNEIVNSYKKEYGVIVSSNLILTFDFTTNGKYENYNNQLNSQGKLQIKIPLSEQTVNITMNTDEIKDSGIIQNVGKSIEIVNNVLAIVTLSLSILLLFVVIIDIVLYFKIREKDVYKSKVNRLLKEYDRLIVNGKTTIRENKYPNKIETYDFNEMIDAAQNLGVPILYYEVIPNEKCFFIVVKEDTIYKYRLTRAFLENGIVDEVEPKKKIVKKKTQSNKEDKTQKK